MNEGKIEELLEGPARAQKPESTNPMAQSGLTATKLRLGPRSSCSSKARGEPTYLLPGYRLSYAKNSERGFDRVVDVLRERITLSSFRSCGEAVGALGIDSTRIGSSW